ncbi:MAG TPA: ABC transporter permease [Ohtaekwangia sp.]|uniref:ABC transporter permease n=1 Tax=Ohtaekwangia sp. TaxID=2066019 RepID=UPI002F946A6F
MFKNYLKIALRNIQRNAVYSFINITGLSIGIACTILILLWVYDEVSYDRFHSNYKEIHQAWINGYYDGTINSFTSVPQPLSEAIKGADSHVKFTALCDWGSEHLLKVGETTVVKRGHFVGPSFLEMFHFPLVKGDARQVLDDPSSIVLTESAAKALFGDKDPINQIVRVDNASELKVAGILKDIPKNSSFQFECLLPWAYYKQYAQWIKETESSWGEFSFQVFVELEPGSNLASVNEQVRDLIKKNVKEEDMRRDVFLYPMSRWRLYSSFKAGQEEGGMIDYVRSFAAVAVFILIIACINFMNLSTARSERRAREVGVRKSVGSRRKELIGQFLGESLLIAGFALILAIVMVEVALPFYNQLVEKNLSLDFTSPFLWIFVVGLALITGLLSGSYPAFYLSSFQPATVLKGKLNTGKGASLPRKVLVTLQFGFSILLIIGTLVIHQQIQHIKSRDLGYDQERLLMIENTADMDKNYRSLKDEILNTGLATAVTKSQSPITAIWSNNFVDWPGKPADQRVLFSTMRVEYDYTKTMGIKVLEGRDFSEDFKSDTAAVLVNQAAIKIMGLKEPIGQDLTIWEQKYKLIGIVDDVLMGSVFRDISPMFVVLRPDASNYVTVRLSKNKTIPESIKEIETIVKKYNPAYPFDYSFADAEFDKKFSGINLISDLSNVFAVLAIFITCLGLFGLAAFTAEQRTKEIGIRKVLGASMGGIVMLMSKDFSKLIIIAFCVSAPLAWWMMDLFLQRYPYRINVPLWILPLAGAGALMFALLIVASQAIKAARTNPAKSLRSE